MNTKAKEIVRGFIEDIWNQQQFDQLEKYLHPAFQDHSLPAALPPNQAGLERWIRATSAAFHHQTSIETAVSEGDTVMVKISMHLQHIGSWRGIEASGAKVFAAGYRCFKLKFNKIVEHWALIDGNAIENQLKQTQVGCKIQV